MDTLETQLLFETSMVKSPALAAIVGFFVPALAAFYTGRIGTGMLYLIIDFLNLMFAITGIGVITAFLFRSLTVPLAYGWAREMNQRELEHTMAAQSERRIPGSRSGRSVRTNGNA